MAGFTKFLFIPLVLLLGQVDFKDEQILFMARCAFYAAAAITLATNYALKGMVNSANDNTRIWVPPPQTGFLPDPNAKLKESTYKEFELNMVGENIKKAFIMLAMMSFLSFKMGLHMPVAIQAAMLPLELFTSPIVAKYLFGSKAATPYDEKLEPPEDNDEAAAAGGAGAAGAGAAGAGATTAAAAATTSSASAKATAQLLDFVVDHWNEEKPFTAAQVAKFVDEGADINAQTPVEPVEDDPTQQVGGMTVLMVACAFKQTKKSDVMSLVSSGASLVSTDHDLWTPLHWACEYGCENAAGALLEYANGEERRFLLQSKDKELKTALDLAKAKGFTSIVTKIEELAASTAELDAADATDAAPAAGEGAASGAGGEGVEDID